MTLLNHLLDLDRMMISINVASQVTSSRNDDTNGTVRNVNINQRLLPLKNDTYHKSCWWKFSSIKDVRSSRTSRNRKSSFCKIKTHHRVFFLIGNYNFKSETPNTYSSDLWLRQFIEIHTCCFNGLLFWPTIPLKHMLLECFIVYVLYEFDPSLIPHWNCKIT